MDFDSKPTVSNAHPETMDLLSRAWCNFAVNEAFQPESQNRSLVLQEYPINNFGNEPKSPNFLKMDNGLKMDERNKSIPSWKSNDVKSWIWMQQAMHPELNYSSCFRKKWQPWKIIPFRSHVSIKKWLKEIKQKRKEDERLQRAEVHAAISVAGVAAALAAIAAEDTKKHNKPNTNTKEAAVASAAALVAAQCAKVAEAMGAKKEQISSVMSSAMSGTSAGDILTLTAAASTSLRGASTLKTRSACKNRLNTNAPVLPLEENNDLEFDFEKCRLILGRGAELSMKTSNGRCIMRSVSVIINREAKVILRTRKLNLLNTFGSKKESVVLDQHAELYNDSEARDSNTCFLIVLTTTRGIIKLDMMDDDQRYTMWARTINHMLTFSTSFTKHGL